MLNGISHDITKHVHVAQCSNTAEHKLPTITTCRMVFSEYIKCHCFSHSCHKTVVVLKEVVISDSIAGIWRIGMSVQV